MYFSPPEADCVFELSTRWRRALRSRGINSLSQKAALRIFGHSHKLAFPPNPTAVVPSFLAL